MDISDASAVVTGGASGLGLATAPDEEVRVADERSTRPARSGPGPSTMAFVFNVHSRTIVGWTAADRDLTTGIRQSRT